MKLGKLCLVSCLLIVASLVVASCASQTTTTPPPQTTTQTQATTTAVQTSVPTTPQYGGTVTIALAREPSGFDESISQPGDAFTLHLTNQELFLGDWTKGAAGTGQATWASGSVRKISLSTGGLAESWEVTVPNKTLVFHLRKDVRFALNPSSEASRLVNGREVTAKDVATVLNKYITTPRSPLSLGDTRKAIITAIGTYDLSVTLPEENFSDMDIIGDYADVDFAPELWTKYGNLTDWRNNVGTGPFILTDYVNSSSATLKKNPNFAGTDPVGPGKGNKLPYVDTVKFVMIPDASTRISALRAAKVDILNAVFWEDAKSLRQTHPMLSEYKYYEDSGLAINMRTDKPNLPYKDKKVRQALMMATDFETIKNTWAGGEGQVVTFPILKVPEYADAYCSIEEASPAAQELYKYNVEKAKALLKDAGYPNGFSAKVAASTTAVDYLSIIKQMWAKVNVDLTIEPKEFGVYMGIFWGRAYDDMMCGGPGPVANLYIAFSFVTGPAGANFSYVDEPVAKEAKQKMMAVALTNTTEADRLHKELMKYMLEQATSIPGVAPPSYHMWWPWVKNYHGESSLGYTNFPNYLRYVWIDQAGKVALGK